MVSSPISTQSASLDHMRYRVIEVNSLSGEGHILSSLSVLEMIYAIVKLQKRNSDSNNPYIWRDPFVLSKGHAALGFYVVLEEMGLIATNELNSFGTHGSRFGGHADARKFPLSYFSTGSLGHGLPVAVGAAFELAKSDPDAITYCICGDGEFMEGSVWESLFFATRMNLANLKILIDCNSTHISQGFSLERLMGILSEIGCATSEVDGHNVDEITAALQEHHSHAPQVLLCHTKMGYGVNLVEGKKEWHRKVVSPEDLIFVKQQFGIA